MTIKDNVEELSVSNAAEPEEQTVNQQQLQQEQQREKPALSIRWAPVFDIPLERRLQMMAVCIWFLLMAASFLFYTYLFLAHRFLWPLLVAYTIFIYMDKAPEAGGRRVDSCRHWKLWKYFADYFPAKLIKEQDLDPTKKYIFGYHPHGIISVGAWITFGTEATHYSQLFPGIQTRLLTLTSNFRIPFYRDLILSLGLASVSKKSCETILSSKEPGAGSIAIVVGGAAESLNARPGVVDLVLRKRLGFIRLAIKHKADLVPVFSFGENDIYNQMENSVGSRLYKFQEWIKSVFGFTLPLFHARGIFNYDVGLIPFRHPIVTVVGKPISAPEIEGADLFEPTTEQLLEIQSRYIAELQSIYDKYKDIYAKDRKHELRIIG
ncbi:diacylglycerol acyltransferase type 2B [Mycotypha africana]|uniref:diacylglycerol acyltransferase type 2B n=1 Tax=Mycotypha africana TaxID=64632 RepID=UPI00230055C0|nr:diacylglycerol acyltransferase type 2B [Mycotypha africana]KAI8988205.1 diacylglycerol acyltransferase type 2B [Mycotypha africana]